MTIAGSVTCAGSTVRGGEDWPRGEAAPLLLGLPTLVLVLVVLVLLLLPESGRRVVETGEDAVLGLELGLGLKGGLLVEDRTVVEMEEDWMLGLGLEVGLVAGAPPSSEGGRGVDARPHPTSMPSTEAALSVVSGEAAPPEWGPAPGVGASSNPPNTLAATSLRRWAWGWGSVLDGGT